jgi:hypothetical protein
MQTLVAMWEAKGLKPVLHLRRPPSWTPTVTRRPRNDQARSIAIAQRLANNLTPTQLL